MENPNATWNDFSTRIIQRDVSFQVLSTFQMTKNKPRLIWTLWAKRWKKYDQNYKSTELMLLKEILEQ